MADKNDPKTPKKRPTATLDLKATEVGDAKEKGTKATAASIGNATRGGKASTGGSGQKSPPQPPNAALSGMAGSTKSGGASIGSLFTHLLSAGLGGVIALAGWSIMGGQNDGGSAVSPRQLTQIESKLSDLENRLSESATIGSGSKTAGISQALKTIGDRLDKTEQSMRDLAADQQSISARTTTVAEKIDTGAGTLDPLKSRLDKLESSLATITKVAENGGQNVRDAALLSGLKARTETIGEEVTDLRSANAALKADTASLKESTGWLQDQATKMQSATAELKSRTARLAQQFAAGQNLSEKLTPFSDRIAMLETTLGGVIQREETARAEGRNTALAIALANLKRVVNQGDPFAGELATLKVLTPAGIDLSALDTHAKSGLPTIRSLAGSFGKYARTALDAETAPPSESLMGRFLSNAKSVIRIRKTGMVEGDTGDAIIARMEHQLGQGRLAEAIKQSESLSEPARKALGPWLGKARARVDGAAAMRQLETKILTALGGVQTQ